MSQNDERFFQMGDPMVKLKHKVDQMDTCGRLLRPSQKFEKFFDPLFTVVETWLPYCNPETNRNIRNSADIKKDLP